MGASVLLSMVINEMAVVIALLNIVGFYLSTLGMPILLKLAPRNRVLLGIMNLLLGPFFSEASCESLV